jgi:hypothetical protein
MTARIVIPADSKARVTFTWDGGTANLIAGQILDVPPGSALETAIGSTNLTDLTGQALVNEQQDSGGVSN